MSYKIKQVANIVGISVRSLHHYDQIGLLKPKKILENGYRLYEDEDLEKLQQILFFKEIGFSLKEIKKIINSPNFDRKKSLLAHKKTLLEKKKQLEQIINTVEKTINSINGGKKMKNKEMFKGFDIKEIEKHKEKYAEETKEKWGNTDAYKESSKKTSKYTKADWKRINSESEQIYKKLIDNMEKGIEGSKVQEAVSEWRLHISKNYYHCSPEMLRMLGETYVSDERFNAHYEKIKVGLANFFRDAINYYCDHQ